MDPYTNTLAIDTNSLIISSFDSLNGIDLINNQNAIAIQNNELKLKLNLESNPTNWGSIVRVQVPATFTDFSGFNTIVYSIKSHARTSLKTRIGLLEQSGELWIQKIKI